MINKEVQKKHGFLVSLDELFDTRLAVLEMMDFEKADELQVSGYFTRERDEFPGVDLYEFRKRYAQRNIAVLANSTMTNLMINLRDIIGSYIVENTYENKEAEVDLVLNTYPYELTKEELNDMVTCIKLHLGNIVPVRVIHQPLKNISSDWLDDNVISFYCYDWNEWLTHHYLEFIKKRLETVVMLCPRIAPLSNQEGINQVNEINKEIEAVKIISEKDLESEDFNEDSFGAIESICKHSGLNLSFVDTRLFCRMLPNEVPTPTEKFKY